jgi:hypothetical protein
LKVIEFKDIEHQISRLVNHISELTHAVHGLTCVLENQKPKRPIRLQVESVQFIEWPEKKENTMDPVTFSLELPSTGEAARLTFAPQDIDGNRVSIDGPVIPTVQGDPASAQTAVSPDGLTLDIQIPNTPDVSAVVEVDADADLSPTNKNVITTMVTLRRLGPVAKQAVTLGAQADVFKTIPADQFGVFPAASARKK